MGVLDKFLDAIKLNDDNDDDEFLDDDLLDEDEDDSDFLDDETESKPKKKFFDKFNKKKASDDEEDDLLDEDEDDVKPSVRTSSASASRAAAAPKPASKPQQTERAVSRPTSSKITPMRSSKRSAAPNMEVCVIKPTSMEDTREIADTLLENATVILNLEGLDMELAQRIIDFTSGSCYSLGGTLQKVSSYIFVLGPYNVDITGDMQNILGGSVPSVRAGY